MSDPDFLKLLNDVSAYVKHEQEEGVRSIEVRARRPAAPAPEPPPAPPPPPPAATAPATVPVAAAGAVEAGLLDIARRVAACTNCPLCKTRTRTVPGQGAATPEILFVGEGPGADEDRQGLAFVGRAGQLLTRIIAAMGFTREQVFIGNIVKCRPPENRTPYPEEMQACLPYLQEQIALLKPKVIVALGATAVRGLLNIEIGITKVRGKWQSYEGTELMPTYHPAYLLRNAAGKKDVWEDMKAVLKKIGREPPPRTKA